MLLSLGGGPSKMNSLGVLRLGMPSFVCREIILKNLVTDTSSTTIISARIKKPGLKFLDP
jgi:hypothetical protein